MTLAFRLRQVWTIARLEARRAFFSKRAFWVYLLALFPSVIFIIHGIDVKMKQREWTAQGPADPRALDSIRYGDTVEEVMQRAGKPIRDHQWERHGKKPAEGRYLMYYDGKRRFDLDFESGILTRKRVNQSFEFSEERKVFAAVFQYFYLRLAIFFGCLGIFMNLFRGEMLDKTLHYWFLAPVRRDVLLLGKYTAGLIAATVIFAGGALICFAAMLWPQNPSELQVFWQEYGLSHALSYAASAALACVGYGSVFLAAGLLLRNPIVPAVVILLWESINGLLPTLLQKLSVLYYVQSLAPVPAPVDPDAPALVRLLASPADPPSASVAVLGLLAVTALVLWAAAQAVRRLEINYGTE